MIWGTGQQNAPLKIQVLYIHSHSFVIALGMCRTCAVLEKKKLKMGSVRKCRTKWRGEARYNRKYVSKNFVRENGLFFENLVFK